MKEHILKFLKLEKGKKFQDNRCIRLYNDFFKLTYAYDFRSFCCYTSDHYQDIAIIVEKWLLKISV